MSETVNVLDFLMRLSMLPFLLWMAYTITYIPYQHNVYRNSLRNMLCNYRQLLK